MKICPYRIGSLIILISAAATVRGQILIGPVLGTGISWVSFHDKESKDFYNQTPVFTYLGGADVSFQVRKRFFMHTGLIYIRKGKNLTSDKAPDLKQKERDHYIDVPVLFTHEFKLKFGGNKEVKFYGGIGPNISYWLGGHGTLNTSQLIEDGYPPLEYKVVFKEKEVYAPGEVQVHEPNRWQLGLNLSVGAVFEPLGFNKIYVNLRYEVGHTYIAKGLPTTFPGVNDYSDDVKARNMGLRLSASYVIDLKTSERKKGKSTMDRVIKKKKR